MSADWQVAWEVMKWPFVASLLFPPLLVYLGLHVVKREVIFVDLALAQVATLGTSVALLMGYHFDDRVTFWVSLAVTFLGAALFRRARDTKKVGGSQGGGIRLTFVVAAAAGNFPFNPGARRESEVPPPVTRGPLDLRERGLCR